jgi:hypothetical protein
MADKTEKDKAERVSNQPRDAQEQQRVEQAQQRDQADQGQSQSRQSQGDLAPASESGDPSVQALLADLQTAISNGNEADQKATRKLLADRGYSG